MEMKIIEKSEKTTVKAVYFSGKFFCTVIYFKGEDGFVEKSIRMVLLKYNKTGKQESLNKTTKG